MAFQKDALDEDYSGFDRCDNEREKREADFLRNKDANFMMKINSLRKKSDRNEEITQKNYNEKLNIYKKNFVSHVTNTNVHAAYATYRIEKSDSDIHWPLMMKIVMDYLEKSYPRKTIVTELTLPMLELCLNVPIQIKLIRGNEKIDLSNPKVINYDDKCFENAIEIIIDLLIQGVITYDMLRIPVRYLEKRDRVLPK